MTGHAMSASITSIFLNWNSDLNRTKQVAANERDRGSQGLHAVSADACVTDAALFPVGQFSRSKPYREGGEPGSSNRLRPEPSTDSPTHISYPNRKIRFHEEFSSHFMSILIGVVKRINLQTVLFLLQSVKLATPNDQLIRTQGISAFLAMHVKGLFSDLMTTIRETSRS